MTMLRVISTHVIQSFKEGHESALATHGSEAKIRELGLMRKEGREYVFQDGDIAHFLFNV